MEKMNKSPTSSEAPSSIKTLFTDYCSSVIQIPKYDPDKVEYVREIVRKHNHIPPEQNSVRYDLTSPSRSPSKTPEPRYSSSSSSSSSSTEQNDYIDIML